LSLSHQRSPGEQTGNQCCQYHFLSKHLLHFLAFLFIG
jgi:hypothetical protein